MITRYVTKKCNKCGKLKPLSSFNKRNGIKRGVAYSCKECAKIARKKYLDSGGRKRNRIRQKQWEQENKEMIAKRMKLYQAKHRKELSEYHNEYKRKKYHTDIGYRLSCNLRSRLYNVLTRDGIKKANYTFDLIGCSMNEFKNYLEKQFKSGMSWDNRSLWHIDHKIPCVSFNLIDVEEQKKCFHYSNLQPLWAKDNLFKGERI